jgi:hypothetical protein
VDPRSSRHCILVLGFITWAARFQSLCITGQALSPLLRLGGGGWHWKDHFPSPTGGFFRVTLCSTSLLWELGLWSSTPPEGASGLILASLLPLSPKPWSLTRDTMSCQQRTCLEFFTYSVSSVKATNPETPPSPPGKQLPHTFQGTPSPGLGQEEPVNFSVWVPQAWACSGWSFLGQWRQ